MNSLANAQAFGQVGYSLKAARVTPPRAGAYNTNVAS